MHRFNTGPRGSFFFPLWNSLTDPLHSGMIKETDDNVQFVAQPCMLKWQINEPWSIPWFIIDVLYNLILYVALISLVNNETDNWKGSRSNTVLSTENTQDVTSVARGLFDDMT